MKKNVNPAAEERNHRTALLLLLGSYGQLQAARFDAEYQSRVTVAASLTDPAEREQAIAQAAQDREQRLKMLEDQLTEFAKAALSTTLFAQNSPSLSDPSHAATAPASAADAPQATGAGASTADHPVPSSGPTNLRIVVETLDTNRH